MPQGLNTPYSVYDYILCFSNFMIPQVIFILTTLFPLLKLALYNEVYLVRKLKNHTNVIRMHEVYESENNIHLVLELV